MFSRENSIGIDRSLTCSSKAAAPDACGEDVELLARLAVGLVEAHPALDGVRHALGGQAALEPLTEAHVAVLVRAPDVRDVGRDRVLADLERGAVEADAGQVVLAAPVRASAHLDVDLAGQLVVDVHRDQALVDRAGSGPSSW